MLKILSAFLLFALTSVGLYVIWYVGRGRHTAEKKAQEKREKEKAAHSTKKQEKALGGAARGSYCYPKINDIMGYDFVKVVNVPDELTREIVAIESKPKDKTWGETPGIGMTRRSVSAVNDEELRRIQMQSEGNDSSNVPFEEKRPAAKPKEIPIEGTTENAPKAEGEEGMELDTVDLESMNPDDIEDFQSGGGFTWVRNDEDMIGEDDDQNVDIIIDNNADRVDEPVINKESEMTIRELEAEKEAEEMSKRIYNSESDEEMKNALEFAQRYQDD